MPFKDFLFFLLFFIKKLLFEFKKIFQDIKIEDYI